jgi:hypothetical protein
MGERAEPKQQKNPKPDESLPEKAKKQPEAYGSEKLSEDDELTKQGHD